MKSLFGQVEPALKDMSVHRHDNQLVWSEVKLLRAEYARLEGAS